MGAVKANELMVTFQGGRGSILKPMSARRGCRNGRLPQGGGKGRHEHCRLRTAGGVKEELGRMLRGVLLPRPKIPLRIHMKMW